MFFKKKTTPDTAQNSIPITRCYPIERIIETTTGTFTKSYRLDDVNFKTATDDEQEEVYWKWRKIIDSFPENSEFQVVIHNHPADMRDMINDIRFEPANDGLNEFRHELNNIMLDKVAKGRHNLTQDRILVVSAKSDKAERAIETLENAEIAIRRPYKMLSENGSLTPQTIEERLKTLFLIYNQEGDVVFENCLDKNGKPVFSLKEMRKKGLGVKDVIAPPGMRFSAREPYFMLGGTYGCSLFLKSFPSERLTSDFLTDLSELPYSYLISIHYERLDSAGIIKKAHNQIKAINTIQSEREQSSMRQGYVNTYNPKAEEDAKEDAQEIMADLMQRDLRPYNISVTMTVFADNQDDLRAQITQVQSVASRHQVQMARASLQQEDAFNSSLPLCMRRLEAKSMLTSETAAIMIPYTTLELNQKNGIVYGVNEETKNIVSFSRLYGLGNHNGLYFGSSGSGKTFAAQLEILSVLGHADTPSQVRIVDPKGNFTTFVKSCGGEIIDLSVSSTTFLNPFDLDIQSDQNPVAKKSEYIIGMVEIMLGENGRLTSSARSAIDHCVEQIYEGYLKHMASIRANGSELTCDPSACPTMSDFYEALLSLGTPEGEELARSIEMYATGTLTTFAHRSNVDTKNRLVLYDVSKLGAGIRDLALYICLSDIQNSLLNNYKSRTWTWFYIDEMHIVLHSAAASKFIADMWMTVRSYQGVPTGIMQNVETILQSEDARHILNTSSFVQIFKVEKMDQDHLKNLLNIPDSMDTYMRAPTRGHGLLHVNSMTIPVDNEIPASSQIYKMCSSSQAVDEVKARGDF